MKPLITLLCCVALAGCAPAAAPTAVAPTATNPPSASTTPLDATPTREQAEPDAGIELVSGTAGTCVNADQTQSMVLDFDVIYHNTTSGNFMSGDLVAPDGEVLGTVNYQTENRDGEGEWGFYPGAYEYPDNTPLTLTLVTYSGSDDASPISSISTLIYDCTTGEAISTTYTRGD